MIPLRSPSFRPLIALLRNELLTRSELVDSGTWQSVPTAGKPEMMTHELEDVVLEFPIGTEDLAYHRQHIEPNLPWADRHFELDRVCGEPRNPGLTWSEWPYANKADSFRDADGQFNHSYAERYWPKYAGLGVGVNDGVPTERLKEDAKDPESTIWGRTYPIEGIRYRYGDLNDVVDLLFKNPGTRGAYLPVTFPEDTGIVHGGRTPCTIGYLFRMRGGRLHVFYDIRSCDFVRHFKDDVYLTIRLLLWVLDRLREKEIEARREPSEVPFWSSIKPGRFLMHVGSLHIFRNDWQTVFPEDDTSQRLVPRFQT
jgi:thymidylate synthase